MKVIPISRPYFSSGEARHASAVIKSGWVSQGRCVEDFEKLIAKRSGAKHAVAVNSGTAALHMALTALGVGSGDEVIIPSFSFIATANAVVYCGARPIFVDIAETGYNIDPDAVEQCIMTRYTRDRRGRLMNKVTRGTLKAIMPVHQFGLPVDMDRIREIAKRYALIVVEDAACAFGARYKGRQVGALSSVSCFSFHPRKIITTAEGGALTTNNSALAAIFVKMRNHGIEPHAVGFSGGTKIAGYELLGYNYRMTDIHAALGVAQMHKLDAIIAKRKAIAARYDMAFRGRSELLIPPVPAWSEPVYQSYVLYLREDAPISRNDLMKRLQRTGVSTRPGNQAIHAEPLYARLFGRAHIPRTERAHDRTISLPIYPSLSRSEQAYVIAKVDACLRRG